MQNARRAEVEAQAEAARLKREMHAHEKMSALGSLVAGLAHEIRTPLTVIGLHAALIDRHVRRLHDSERTSAMSESVREIHAGVSRVNVLVAQLRRLHRLAPGKRVEASLDRVVAEAIAFFVAANPGGLPIVVEDNGCGRGLAIAKRIADEHAGEVRSVSAPGVGTSMTVSIPLPT